MAHTEIDSAAQMAPPSAPGSDEEGRGFFNGERLAMSAMALGFSQACYDEALDWASERLTPSGLPRRVPKTNMAPGMVASQQAGANPAPPGPAPGRSPDEVRSMLSSYRTGIERGRTVAGGGEAGERPPDAT